MQRLMGTSPLVIRDAIAHSTSQLELDILDHRVSAPEVVKSPAASTLLVCHSLSVVLRITNK
jgi:hypothetical protein